jgi:hypothetical protein
VHSIGKRLPVEGHIDEVRQSDDENDRAEVDREDADLFAAHLLHEQC